MNSGKIYFVELSAVGREAGNKNGSCYLQEHHCIYAWRTMEYAPEGI